MSRATEIPLVDPEHRVVWLAREVDDVEETLTAGINRLVEATEANQRRLTGVLIGIIVALIAFPVELFVKLGH